jgi:DNA-binding SARP family transcriptional activator
VQVKILGPLSIVRDSVSAVPTARMPRRTLSLLLVNDSRTVSTATLISELWSEQAPKSCQTLVQSYVLHLRRLFAHAFGLTPAEIAHDLLQTRSGGYAFVLEHGELDLHNYQRWRATADRALAERDDDAAAAAYRRALDEWQGRVLADVEPGPLVEAEIARLEQSRLTAIERMVEAQLRLGRHHDALAELAALAVLHPFHEGLQALFMLALYRSGNRNRALEVFSNLRTTLIAELGIEPTPKLQRLHHAILVAEPSLELTEPTLDPLRSLR